MGIKSRKRKCQEGEEDGKLSKRKLQSSEEDVRSNPQMEEIEEKKQKFMSDRTHANKILQVIKILNNVGGDERVLCAAVDAVVDMITHVEQQGDLVFKSPIQGVESAEGKYVVWLLNCYSEAWSNMTSLLTQSNSVSVQICSVSALLTCITLEGKHIAFPQQHLNELVSCVLNIDNPASLSLVRSMISGYFDVKKSTMQALKHTLPEPAKLTQTYLQNIVKCALCCTFTTDEEPNYLCAPGLSEEPGVLDKKTKSAFNAVWLWILSQSLPAALMRKILPELHIHVLPHMKSPLSLTDFYMDAFDSGGMMSIMSLNGIFILMQKHNLDYPSFYSKLYTLVQAEVLHVSHCSAFFTLLNIFLSSTHLTEYLVCAYIKRLSRLCHTAPPHTLPMLFNLVRNLLIRHPNLQYLLHNTEAELDSCSDPYDVNEVDPSLSKADKSSLWEIKSLQSHVLPEISRAARFIDKALPTVERKFKCDIDMDEFFDECCGKISDDVPLTFVEPKSLFFSEDSIFSKHWSLT